MTVSRQSLLVALMLCVATAWGQDSREPHIGYLYPGGGQQGAVCKITVGGQFIRGANKVYVSGEGVHAKVVKYYRPVRNIQKDQREDLQRRFREVRDKRLAELPEKQRKALAAVYANIQYFGRRPGRPSGKTPVKRAANTVKPKPGSENPKAANKKAATAKAPFRPVEHPLLDDLEDKSLRELRHVAYHLFFPRQKRQMNVQIAELVRLEVTIDPDAAPGDRELRIDTPTGLTNPMVFQVGQLPEISELEPNDPRPYVNPNLLKVPPVDLPVLLNGQIMPGDVDRFRIRARQGQQLVMQAHARRLIPYLADAVPGWFQATLALYDENGDEVAFADDYRFDPDPVLFYKIPADGIYELEIRDSIYRGREDFVYRVAVGEQPFITQAFPLGGPTGVKTVASVDGWNLTHTQLPLDTRAGNDSIRQTTLRDGKWLSNEVTYAVDSLPECLETEPNNTIDGAQLVELPQIVNGLIAQPGDVDVFKFKGRAGDEVVAEVYGRRLHSPLDSLLRLTDASGRVLDWNDDYEQKEGLLRTDMGLLTHPADSYLMTRLPEDGVFYVHLVDTQRHGGAAFGYRLHITPAQPDFALRLTPSSISIPAGGAVAVTLHALRKNGFDGEIELALKDAPPGFTLSGGRIPSGQERVRMTLKAPWKPPGQPVILKLEGRARIDGETVSRAVVPAEDMMQAFLWRHLTPSQELVVSVMKIRARVPTVALASRGPIRIPEGGTAQVRIRTPKRPAQQKIQLKLSEPPEGLTLQNVRVVPDGVAFLVKADGDKVKAGFANNLIVEAFGEVTWKNRQTKKPTKRRVSFGVLPAIPFEIVQR